MFSIWIDWLNGFKRRLQSYFSYIVAANAPIHALLISF